MIEPLYTLPASWQWAGLTEIALELESGGRPKGGVRGITSGVPSIGGEHLSADGGFDFSSIRFVPQSFSDSMHKGRVQKGDILIVKDGATTGKTSFVGDNFPYPTAVLDEHVFRLRVHSDAALQRYVFYFLRGPIGQGMIEDSFRGSAQGGINQRFAEFVHVPLAPIPEQRRILEKVEPALRTVVSTRNAFANIPTLLKKLRQSVLTKAFRGELTEPHPDDEPAEMILRRIEQKKGSSETNRLGKHSRNYRNEKPRFSVLRDELSGVPSGWTWTTLGNLAEVRGGVTKGRKFGGKRTVKVPYLRVANVQSGYLDLDIVKEIDVLPEEVAEYQLRLGDILFTEGGDRDKLGRGAVWHEEVPVCIHQNHIFRARLRTTDVLPEYISFMSQSLFGRDYFSAVASQTVNLASINITNLRSFPIPLAPSQEQFRVVGKIEQILGFGLQIEKSVKGVLNNIETFERSFLTRAFQGKIVPQDPKDEPVSVTLERIRKQLAAMGNKAVRRNLEEFASPATIIPEA